MWTAKEDLIINEVFCGCLWASILMRCKNKLLKDNERAIIIQNKFWKVYLGKLNVERISICAKKKLKYDINANKL